MFPRPALFLLLLGLGCGPHPVSPSSSPVDAGPLVRVSFEVNEEAKPFKPSLAIWAASDQLSETIFVSRKVAEGRYFGARERPENLPVWQGVEQGSVDAVTAATPKPGPSELLWHPPEAFQAGPFDVLVEVNASFDSNETWPDKGGVNGQPSLIWRASLPALPSEPVTVEAQLVGHGRLDGADAAMVEGELEGFTTARTLIYDLRVTYEP
jgi:hypothetical protein